MRNAQVVSSMQLVLTLTALCSQHRTISAFLVPTTPATTTVVATKNNGLPWGFSSASPTSTSTSTTSLFLASKYEYFDSSNQLSSFSYNINSQEQFDERGAAARGRGSPAPRAQFHQPITNNNNSSAGRRGNNAAYNPVTNGRTNNNGRATTNQYYQQEPPPAAQQRYISQNAPSPGFASQNVGSLSKSAWTGPKNAKEAPGHTSTGGTFSFQ